MRENVCLGKFHLFEPTYFAAIKKTMHAYVVYFASQHSSHTNYIFTLQTFYHLRQSLWNWRAHQKMWKHKWKGNARIRQFYTYNGFCWLCYQYTPGPIISLSHSANYLECCHENSCFCWSYESYRFFFVVVALINKRMWVLSFGHCAKKRQILF